MLKRLFLVCYLLLLPLAGWTQSTERFENKRIAAIEVVAHQLPPGATFDPQAVRTRLRTKIGEPFNQEDFDKDLKLLSEQYHRVEPKLSVMNDQLYINLDIWPKPQIKEILWKGNEQIKASRLQKELGIKPGDAFDRSSFSQAFNKLKAYYVKKGYFQAQLKYTIVPHEETGQVTIEVTVEEGPSGTIDEIVFQGFTDSEEQQLLKQMITKPYNIFLSWITKEGTYQQEAIQADEMRILDFLQNEGYADAKVTIRTLPAQRQGRIIVEISAEKGTSYTCGKILFTGNTVYSNAQIEALLTLKPGSPYSPEEVRASVEAITNFYGEHGYIETHVGFEPTLRLNEPVYDIKFTIEEGEQYRIGLIKIFGNTTTQTRVILHESLLVPGEVFNIRKLKATEERLRGIDYFKNVNVYAVKTSADSGLGPNYRDVYIEVEESNTGNFSLFGGFSTLDTLFGGIEIVERNFNGAGLRNLFRHGLGSLRGGGEYLRARVNIGMKFSSYLLSWTKPYFLDTPWIIGFEAEKATNRRQGSNYEIDSLGLNFHANYPLNDFLTFGWHYRISNSQVRLTLSEQELQKMAKEKPNEYNALQNEAKNKGTISATGLSLSYDSVTNPQKPHKGLRSELFTEIAGTFLGGKYEFLSSGYLNTLYVPISSRGTSKSRADVRFVQPIGHGSNKVPISERLFLGGETTVRGYAPFIIGPKFDSGDASGGLSSWLFSEEYNHRLISILDAFAFVDAGAVSAKRYKFSTLRLSYGLGLRIDVLKRFPLTIGLGFPINPERKTDVRHFFFSVGGSF